MPSNLWADLRRDLAGEKKAISDYSQRIKQTKGTKLAPMLTEIRDDERDHRGLLSKALQGLKASTPTEK